jgi:type VI protein secretion system component VasF
MSTQSEQQRDRWNTMVVPAAKGLERFFWNLAWFCVLLMVLFGGLMHSQHAATNRERGIAPADIR